MKAIYQPSGKAREYAPWACNIYRGCGHGCIYCYAPSVLRMKRSEFHGNVRTRHEVVEALAKEAPKHAQEHPGEPVLLCFTCDPYGSFNAGNGTWATRRAIKTLILNHVPVHVLTKGGTEAERDFDLLACVKGSAYAVTLTTMDATMASTWEPYAASPQDRLKSLRTAQAMGVPTWLSLEPVIDHASALHVIERCAPFVDEFRVGKLNYHPTAREIDWPRFRDEAVALLERLGCRFYIKEDLRNA